MKTLIIIRHAKAEQTLGKDSKRKLTERGERDAIAMAQHLLNKGYKINKIFSSPSVRTKETSAIFAEKQGIDPSNIVIFDNLYLGDTLQITEAIEWLQEDISTLAVIAHNPGVTNFVNDMTDSAEESIPTCGVAIIKVDCTDWQQFGSAKKTLVEIDRP